MKTGSDAGGKGHLKEVNRALIRRKGKGHVLNRGQL